MLFFIFIVIVAIVIFCIVKALINSQKARKYASRTYYFADKANTLHDFYRNHFDNNTKINRHNDIDDIDIDINDINPH